MLTFRNIEPETTRVKTSASVAAIVPALLEARQEFGPAVKNARNPHRDSRYINLEGVLDAVEPALHKAGMFISQGPDISPEGKPLLSTRVWHNSGEWIETSYPLPPDGAADPQKLGAAITYGRRYALMALFSIAAEDDDGESPRPDRHQGNGKGNHQGNGQRRDNRSRRDHSNGEGQGAEARDEVKRNFPAQRQAPARDTRPPATNGNGKQPAGWDQIIDAAINAWHAFDPIKDEKERTAREHRIAHTIASYAVTDGKINQERLLKPAEAGKEQKRDPAKVWNAVKALLIDDRAYVINSIKHYLDEKKEDLAVQQAPNN